ARPSALNSSAVMSASLQPVFVRLCAILEKHLPQPNVRHVKRGYLWFELPPTPKLNKPLWIAGVQLGKNYVSYHFMPVYMRPQLLAAASAELLARKQGKACFNFKAIDEPLFAE